MTDGLIRNMVFARAMSVEPIARVLCPDPCGVAGQPFIRSQDRWQSVATRAALTSTHLQNQEKPG
jgi:hypothetical protein